NAKFEDLEERRDQAAVVLVVRVQHENDVCAVGEGGVVAGLLVSAVAAVLLVNDGGQAEFAGDIDGVIAASVIDEDDFVDAIARQIIDGGLQGRFGVVSGQDDDAAIERPSLVANAADDVIG